MWWIELFTANKEPIATLPTPHKLSTYAKGISSALQTARDNPPDDEPGELQRDSEVLAAKFMGVAMRFENGDHSPETSRELERVTLAYVLSAPEVRCNMLELARDHVVQIALPATPAGEAEIQWRRTTGEDVKDFLRSLDDLETVQLYVEQVQEILDMVRDEIDRNTESQS